MNPEAREKSYTIKGMDCAGCALKIEKAVSKISGVKLARISFAAEKLKVISEDPAVESDILEVIKKMGYSVEPEDAHRIVTLKVGGMDCAECAQHVEHAIAGLPGVNR